MTKQEKLRLACRRVYGKEGVRSPDQQIVYDNLVWTAKQPAGSEANNFETNPILMNVGVTDWIWQYLETYVDSKPQEDEQKTQVKSE